MRQVPESEIKNRLAFDNPWWEEGAVDERFRIWPRRAYFDGFVKLVTETAVRRAVVLMGPRRVGKTVMIHQAVQHLLENGIDPKRVLYLSVDTPVYTGRTLENLLRDFLEVHGHGRQGPVFAFFDEIQYHPEWEIHLKSLVDSYPAIRFIVSGSAAAALKLKDRESGAGRFTDFVLPPLTFSEFLEFAEREPEVGDEALKLLSEIGVFDPRTDTDSFSRFFDILAGCGPHTVGFVDHLNRAFIDYLNFGGFPEAILEKKVRDQMDRFVANDIIDKVLLRDLPSLYGVSDTLELKRLFTTLAYNTGQEVSIEALAQTAQAAKNTIKKYLDYLEAAFLIVRLYRVDQNARRLKKRSHFKVHLTNPCLRAALFGAVKEDDPSMGLIAESALVSQYAHARVSDRLHFARWKSGEVDVVVLAPDLRGVQLAMEVKWSDRPFRQADRVLKRFIGFCRKNNPEVCYVTTKTIYAVQYVEGVKVKFVPLALDCWLSGKLFLYEDVTAGKYPLTG